MKKILLGVLFLAIIANSAVNQSSVIGNWTLEKTQKASPNSIIITLEADTLKLTSDWKLAEVSIYDISYPDFGPQKINLKYKLKIISEGEYRLDSELKKYPKNPTSEIIEGSASDDEAAQSSKKEIEKLIKEEFKNFMPILNVSETELELQATSGNIKFTKPKRLPVSKLTGDSVPFFPPEGWRFPETAKELAFFEKRLKNDARRSLFTMARGDFNGDGFRDAVAYLMNGSTGQVALFLNLSKSDGSYELNPYGSADKNTIIENGVMQAPPGEYVNSVSKAKITIENPGFMIIIFDTAANLIYWDAKSNDWISIPVGKKF